MACLLDLKYWLAGLRTANPDAIGWIAVVTGKNYVSLKAYIGNGQSMLNLLSSCPLLYGFCEWVTVSLVLTLCSPERSKLFKDSTKCVRRAECSGS